MDFTWNVGALWCHVADVLDVHIFLGVSASERDVIRIIIHFVHFQFKGFSFKLSVLSLNFNNLIFIFLYLILEEHKFTFSLLISQVCFMHLVLKDIHLLLVVLCFSLSIFNLMLQHNTIGLSLTLHKVNKFCIMCLLLIFGPAFICFLVHKTQLTVDILSWKNSIRLQQIWNVFRLCDLVELWIKVINLGVKTLELLSENSLVSHLSDAALSLILTASFWVDVWWNILSIFVGHCDRFSFVACKS
jgi:hypothetical protein